MLLDIPQRMGQTSQQKKKKKITQLKVSIVLMSRNLAINQRNFYSESPILLAR